MGILIDASDEGDKQVYDDAWKDIQSILHNADDFSYAKVEKEDKFAVKPVAKPGVSAGTTNGTGKFHSATALSKEMNISSKELFARLEGLRWIIRVNENWELTDSGKEKGGQMRKG